jgi:hypothetical protein
VGEAAWATSREAATVAARRRKKKNRERCFVFIVYTLSYGRLTRPSL